MQHPRLSACPVATVAAPVGRVWRLLDDPRRYALWWDAHTVSIRPDGAAQSGQQVYAQAAALGTRWNVHITIQRVAPETRELELLTRLPFGISIVNHIRCTPVDEDRTRVSFG